MATGKRLGAAVFGWLTFSLLTVVWILSIASTATVDWSKVDGTLIKVGIWKACLIDSSRCGNIEDNNLTVFASSGCMGLIKAVRAFSILTILAAFFASVAVLVVELCHFGGICRNWFLLLGLVGSILTFIFAILPWTIYLGFAGDSGCILSNTLGGAWGLALAAWVLTLFVLPLAWLWFSYHLWHAASKAEAMQGGEKGTGALGAAGGVGYAPGAYATQTYPTAAAPPTTYLQGASQPSPEAGEAPPSAFSHPMYAPPNSAYSSPGQMQRV